MHTPRLRSWLFAPADSLKKMRKAIESDADIALLDLEDSVMPQNKSAARTALSEIMEGLGPDERARVWVRINPLDTPEVLGDLVACVRLRPGGVFLPKAEGRGHIEQLHHYLDALEAANGQERGAIRIAALVTETPRSMFQTGDYAGSYPGSQRLIAMSWGAEDLSSALGASAQRGADGEYAPTYEMARSLCLLGAVSAGVAPIETVQPEFRDLEALRKRAEACRAAGFRGMLAIHPAQIEPINIAFTPGDAEIEHARAVVKAFAENPGAGTIAIDGAMLDRPHLALAERLLAEAESQGPGA